MSIAVCNGAGHFPMLEAPEALSVALRRFVGGLRRRTHVSDGTWAYRPDCVWTDPEAPEMADAGQAREANVILLVAEGTDLPSNLQGLYECRYQGDQLDGVATMKLLKAFNGFQLS